MTTPHKWAHVIKAWADGKTIQQRVAATKGPWTDVRFNPEITPLFGAGYDFRVPVLHQEAWDHYAAGGDVTCKYGSYNDLPASLWHHSENDRVRFLKDDRWDNPMFQFTIVPKEVVVTAFVELEATIFDSDFRDGVKHNLKLTFNSEGKLLKAEVIG